MDLTPRKFPGTAHMRAVRSLGNQYPAKPILQHTCGNL
jgi:hypothetical protein